jgi:hypothetical protein
LPAGNDRVSNWRGDRGRVEERRRVVDRQHALDVSTDLRIGSLQQRDAIRETGTHGLVKPLNLDLKIGGHGVLEWSRTTP